MPVPRTSSPSQKPLRRAQFGERLQLARKMAGLSYQGLADKLNGLVTKQSLHKYEQGSMHPDSEKLIAFANALNVTVDFF